MSPPASRGPGPTTPGPPGRAEICQAAIWAGGHAANWTICGRPATHVYAYGCVHEHITQRPNCADHLPKPGVVGCRQCFEAGHDCEMTFRLISGSGP